VTKSFKARLCINFLEILRSFWKSFFCGGGDRPACSISEFGKQRTRGVGKTCTVLVVLTSLARDCTVSAVVAI